jgi:hypothetical protein
MLDVRKTTHVLWITVCLERKLCKATRQCLAMPLGYRRSKRCHLERRARGGGTGELASRGSRDWGANGGHAAVTVTDNKAFSTPTYSFPSTSVVTTREIPCGRDARVHIDQAMAVYVLTILIIRM